MSKHASPTAGSPLAAELASAGRSLAKREPILTKILENLPVALFAKDVQDNYRVVMWNGMAESLFGIQRANIIGKTDYDMFPDSEADFFRHTDEKVMESGQVVDIAEEPITTARGTWTAHTVKVPIYDEKGRPSILFGLVEDITVQKEAAADRAAKIEAERANLAKSEFLANMSHELRTPLNSLLGMVQLLEDTPLDATQQKMLQTMRQAGQLLTKTVDDVLDFSKIEAGQVELESIGFELKSVFTQSVELLQPIAARKKLALKLDWPQDNAPAVLGDPMRLARVLNNLIGNAIKYTERGSIRVKAGWWQTAEGTVLLDASVEDTGIGIAAEKHETIFHKFSQADTSTTRQYGGTGLGLAITRELVALMGGQIKVESIPDKGSCFRFHIPFPPADAVEEAAPGAAEIATRGHLPQPAEVRLLVAEDNALNRLYMEKLLESYGFSQVTFVENGAQAVKECKTGRYDLVFMDCHMPEKNGYEATLDIRAMEEGIGRRIPIIAMTANALSGEREKCIRAGMDEYISKPVDMVQFRAVLGRWVAMPEKPSLQSTAPRREPDDISPPVDMAEIRVYSSGNRDKERYLVEIFARQVEQVLATLNQHCSDGENNAWTEAAHLLKGTAASLGAAQLHVLCSRAQDGAQTASFRRDLLNEIEHEVGRILKFFDGLGLVADAA